MSFSYKAPRPSGKKEPLEFVIKKAGEFGLLVVASAGNDGDNNDMVDEPSYPASFTCNNIIAVASVNCEEELSTFSNSGYRSVDISTLGEDIVAPDHTGILVAKNGTSQATAITSGVAGVLATNLININWSPIKCSIINGAKYNANIMGLMFTEGVVDANTSFNELVMHCGTGYRSGLIKEEEIESGFNEVSIYPNPFNEQCEIKCEMKNAETVTVNIYNELGQLISTTLHELDKGTHLLKWSPEHTIPIGMYFVRVQTTNEEFIRKVIKLQ